MKTKVYLATALCMLLASAARAAIVSYQFTGTSTISLNPPFGMPIPTGTAISGTFQYDPSAPAFSTVGNLSVYPQSIAGGLTANFGNYLVSASSYLIKIRNDSSGSDIFTVQWSSADNPPPSSPLVANGLNQNAGIFSIVLAYASNPFSDTSLPATLSTSDYNAQTPSFISQQLIPLDVAFAITSLTPIPEPAGWILAAAGLLTIGIEGWRRIRHNLPV